MVIDKQLGLLEFEEVETVEDYKVSSVTPAIPL